jgi:hypothetical protein
MSLRSFFASFVRGPGSTARVKRQCRPHISRLEARTVMDASVLSIAANPATLWPSNGRLVPVRVTGDIADTDTPDVGATFRVIDEYGAVQPSGPVTLQDNGDGTFSYTFTVQLQARRLGQDRDGRQYTILVDAADGDTADDAATVVTVPHDQGRRGGFNPGRGRGTDGPRFGDDRDGRPFDGPKRGKGPKPRDLVPVARPDHGPDWDSDDGPRKGKGKGRGKD